MNATVDYENGKVTMLLPIGTDGSAYLATMTPNEARHLANALEAGARRCELHTKLTTEEAYDGHASDCATHNEPAFAADRCNCGYASRREASRAMKPDEETV